MKKIFALLSLAAIAAFSHKTNAQTTIRIYDTALFYDGYAGLSTATTPAPPGTVRLKTSLYSKKLSEAVLGQIGNSLSMKVLVKASCDNYDRGGHVSLAFVPKGDTTYTTGDTAVKRLEIARFITPFMNKNLQPDTVPYNYEINNVASILKENKITDIYDIWMELEIFGVPYAANNEIPGCSGRSDVFYGTLDLITDASAPRENNNIIIPIYNQKSFNNYQANATDSLTTTVKTVTFNLSDSSYNTSIYLITSNHGANSGGEEYNRRNHFVYFDGTQVLQYKPGFPTCEPYRIYNTQGNGIYGSAPRSDAQWQSFSNWCPGAYIPIRVINVGNLAPGTHTFKIAVPDAKFVGGQGNFPLSLYVQGKTEYIAPVGVNDINKIAANTTLYPNPAKQEINIRTEQKVEKVIMFNMVGQQVWAGNSKTIDITALQYGVYYVKIQLEGNIMVTKSFVKN
ncbi:T9SS type A sorting domain-containing protein [Taibaiella lutea]|uniref:T9SS type A sorting domain-containing protein n=1 Tax=Taibaiella lutea TaxID=2608001 RepID=A0A5M6CIE0_9BACT|nr:peptide-N-glycosidase F-related protein [Taibaiella lutea]KAA5534783.1 T9SS type A sorting domain-containing protein [Taibaiella lutea]